MSQVIVKDIHSTALSSSSIFRPPFLSAVPSSSAGNVGDVVFVNDTTTPANTAMYIRYPSGWKKVTAV